MFFVAGGKRNIKYGYSQEQYPENPVLMALFRTFQARVERRGTPENLD
jgi:hypothetical protein